MEAQHKITLSDERFMMLSVDGMAHIYNKGGNGMGLSVKVQDLGELALFLEEANSYMIAVGVFAP